MRVCGILSGTSYDGIDVGVFEINEKPKIKNENKKENNDLNKPIFADEFKYFIKTICFETIDFKPKLKNKILSFIQNTKDTSNFLQKICCLNFELGEAFGDAIIEVLKKNNISFDSLNIIGSHGVTLWHEIQIKEKKFIPIATLQLGESTVISKKLNCITISDFRTMDVSCGGQGAPLTSILDYCLLKPKTSIIHKNINNLLKVNNKNEKTIYLRAIQNIGGMGNVSFVCEEQDINQDIDKQNFFQSIKNQLSKLCISFDTGPGNVMIDEGMRIQSNGKIQFDEDGNCAKLGKVNSELLNKILSLEYFHIPPPKTTGRELFSCENIKKYYDYGKNKLNLSHNDIISTFTQITAISIIDSYKNFAIPKFKSKYLQINNNNNNNNNNNKENDKIKIKLYDIIIGGGGKHNKELMKRIQIEAQKNFGKHVKVKIHEDLKEEEGINISSDAKESLLFAFLAYLNIKKRIGNIKEVTGAKNYCILGKTTYPPF